MSYMTYADDLATIEVLEGDYAKEALETDELLDECLNRCNLERHLGKQVCMLGGLGSRKRADEIEEKADGKLGVFTPIATYLGGLFVPSGSSTEEAKKRCARADEGAAGVAFPQRNVDQKWKLTLFKALVQGALTSAGKTRCYSESDLKKLESKQCMLARRILGKRGYGKIKGQKATGVEMMRRRAKLHTIESVLRQTTDDVEDLC